MISQLTLVNADAGQLCPHLMPAGF